MLLGNGASANLHEEGLCIKLPAQDLRELAGVLEKIDDLYLRRRLNRGQRP